jgi:hypothetical protein
MLRMPAWSGGRRKNEGNGFALRPGGASFKMDAQKSASGQCQPRPAKMASPTRKRAQKFAQRRSLAGKNLPASQIESGRGLPRPSPLRSFCRTDRMQQRETSDHI